MDYKEPSAAKTGHLPAYKRIAGALRDDILSGKYPPGSLLPSTEDFAGLLSSSYYTVHTALTALVKEGWVERLHGHGTYVAHPERRFLSVGIYHSLDIFSDEETSYQRQLNELLVNKLQALKKTTHLIIDSRPEIVQDDMFEPLAQAIRQRQIHCLVAPSVNSKSLPLIRNLPIPVAYMTGKENHGIGYDEAGFLRGSIRALAQQGCRSIGFVTSVPVIDGNFDLFKREIGDAGLQTRPEWMIQPSEFQHHLVDFGYLAFRKFWKLPQRPEGLIIYPDTAVRGAITAILQAGVRVPQELKFVFHRNANARILCPFPVTWGVSEESATADALIESIQKQFAGEKLADVTIPYRFQFEDGSRWLG